MKKFLKQFGGKLRKEDIANFELSPHWDGKIFQNLEETSLSFDLTELPEFLKKQICGTEGREPAKPLDILPLDKEAFLAPADHMKFVWYGHAVVLMRLNNKTILIDPMLGPDASPMVPTSIKRFSTNTLDLIDDFPEIDSLMLTHDHYDHLDLDSIIKLMPKVKSYHVALGVKRHLVKWGVDPSIITEYGWWEDYMLEDILITFTPTRHFGGRGLTDRAKSLWGGWAFRTDKERFYFSGDGGYGAHFKEVGERLGGFDFAWMEAGQYNKNWLAIHMTPEHSVQAAIDAGVKKAMPFHWAGFALAQHTWTDPAERFAAESSNKALPYCLPRLGELVEHYSSFTGSNWWETLI